MTSDNETTNLLAAVGTAIGRVARRQGPAVVGIERRTGRGSGFVVARDEVLTLASNLHDPAGEVRIVHGAATSAAGEVAGIDGALDLALLRVVTADIQPLAFAPGSAGVGAPVIALANPGGQGLRATLGFVAAGERSYRGPRGRIVAGAIEHTAALARGSGGGPLLDLEGRVLGLNAVRVHGGLILTLPGGAAARRLEVLRGAGPGGTPQLGLAILAPPVARRLRRAVGLPERDGLLVHAVAAGSAAERARIREGDLIVAASGTPVDHVDGLYAQLDRVAAGGTIDLRILRGVAEREVAVSLGGPG